MVKGSSKSRKKTSDRNNSGASSNFVNYNIITGAFNSKSKNTGTPFTAVKGVIQVLDEEGVDVTPLPLMSPNKSHRAVGSSRGASGSDMLASTRMETGGVAEMLNNLESMAHKTSFSPSIFKPLGFSQASRASTASEDDSQSMISNETDDTDLYTADPSKAGKTESNWSSKKATVTEADPNRMIHLTFVETDTICLVDVPSICVSNDFVEELAQVKAANARYKDLKAKQNNNENLVQKSMQTFNYACKNKEVQATALRYANAECMVNQWAIYDSYNSENASQDALDSEKDESKDPQDDNLPGLDSVAADASSNEAILSVLGTGSSLSMPLTASVLTSGSIHQTIAEESSSENPSITTSMMESSSSINAQNMQVPVPPLVADDREAEFNALNQQSLKASLLIMERAILGNVYISKLLEYRNVPKSYIGSDLIDYELSSERGDGEDAIHLDAPTRTADQYTGNIPSMHFLWSFRCELTRSRTVNYMSWNKVNEDIIAIAYGESKTNALSQQSPGLVLCWSVKNPEWPERIYKTPTAVTSLDFSKTSPNLLAVGCTDGRIAIYDVRKKDVKPVLDNRGYPGKNREAVWELKWVERERVHGDEETKGESLVSVSTDGRVTQWVIHKGLEHTDLMTLKRINKQQETKTGGNGRSGAFISRLAGGLCFDFNPKDSNVYVVGTDDGHIHRCSCTLYEQYLNTYFGHTSPVYRIKWSPFLPATFLSCSADWTVRLWNQDSEECVFKFQSGKDSISDVAWSPTCSTVFGCVSTDGRMEIWDLGFSVLDPAILHSVLDRQLTSIAFAPTSPAILIGDDNGAVNFYKLENTSINTHGSLSFEEQSARLSAVMSMNQNQGLAPAAIAA